MRVLIIQGPQGSGKASRLNWHRERNPTALVEDEVTVAQFQQLTVANTKLLIVTMSSQTYENIPLTLMCARRLTIKVETLIKEI